MQNKNSQRKLTIFLQTYRGTGMYGRHILFARRSEKDGTRRGGKERTGL